jgi:outer membrane protein insertion porin family
VESSIMAFQRDLTDLTYGTTDATNYVAYSRGLMAFARYRWHAIRVGLRYSYDISDFTTLNEGSADFFQNLEYRHSYSTNPLNGIRTSTITPSFSYNTVNNPLQPTQGTSVDASLAIAGLGGDVSTLEPIIDAKHFRPGFLPRHVIAIHLRASMTYGGNGVPPFDRYYMGGDNELRGFPSWSIGPAAYFPSATAVDLLNNDGTPVLQRIVVNGNTTFVNVTTVVPIYRPLSVGGDTKIVANAEYRIPIKGPFSLALFLDAGVNRLTFPNRLRLTEQRVSSLDNLFPEAAFRDRPIIQPGTQKIRMSTGTEWQYWLPKVNAPLRFDIAYNPMVYGAVLQPPIVADRGYFPNAATYFAALTQTAFADYYRERRFMFRFSIGRTF